MPSKVKVLSARRAYEFSPDDLRLTLLSVSAVIERIQDTFKFQQALPGTPTPTFGPVPQTLPPGLAFGTGSFVSEETGVVPIRLLHFEPRRIVLDVAGHSSTIGPIYLYLTELLKGLVASDGTEAIGQYTRILDSSEITAKLSFPAGQTLAPALLDVFTAALGANGHGKVGVPTIGVQLQDPNAEFAGVTGGNQVGGPAIQLALRQGRQLSEQIYYSVAPLTTEAHIEYLAKLEGALSVQGELTSTSKQ
jgi:hypothetical protein